MLIRAVVVWFGLMVLAILNGAVRTSWLEPWIGDAWAHVASTVMLSALILGAAWVVSPWLRLRSVRDAWIVGSVWVTMTVAFEFLAGHYVFGQPWDRLLADYDVARGRIWPLVLVTSLVAPVVVVWRRRCSAARGGDEVHP